MIRPRMVLLTLSNMMLGRNHLLRDWHHSRQEPSSSNAEIYLLLIKMDNLILTSRYGILVKK
jgi:hypothetical protein